MQSERHVVVPELGQTLSHAEGGRGQPLWVQRIAVAAEQHVQAPLLEALVLPLNLPVEEAEAEKHGVQKRLERAAALLVRATRLARGITHLHACHGQLAVSTTPVAPEELEWVELWEEIHPVPVRTVLLDVDRGQVHVVVPQLQEEGQLA